MLLFVSISLFVLRRNSGNGGNKNSKSGWTAYVVIRGNGGDKEQREIA